MALSTSTETERRSIINWDTGEALPIAEGSLGGTGQRQHFLNIPRVTGGLSGAFKLKRNLTVKLTNNDRSITAKILSGNRTITEKILFEQE